MGCCEVGGIVVGRLMCAGQRYLQAEIDYFYFVSHFVTEDVEKC